VRFLLDELCRLWTDWYSEERPYTHEDAKIMMYSRGPNTIWGCNRRLVDRRLREIRNHRHWRNPRGNPSRRRYLWFSDTDGNDWSQIAESLIEMCLARRVWVHSDGDPYESDDPRLIEDEEGNRDIRYID
jgi:hypothetical protein